MPGREEVRLVAQVPFAKNPRTISPFCQEFRKGLFGRMEPNPASRHKGIMDPDPIRVTTRQESSAGSGTNRLGGIIICKLQTAFSHGVQVRGVNIAGSENTDIPIALVVGKNNDDIRRAYFLLHAAFRMVFTGHCKCAQQETQKGPHDPNGGLLKAITKS